MTRKEFKRIMLGKKSEPQGRVSFSVSGEAKRNIDFSLWQFSEEDKQKWSRRNRSSSQMSQGQTLA